MNYDVKNGTFIWDLKIIFFYQLWL